MMRLILFLLCFSFPLFALGESSHGIPLQHADIHLADQPTLQRGARLYMNYCAGCHSLRYMRFSRMATDLGITDPRGKVDKTLVEQNLIFTGASIHDTLNIAMPEEGAAGWFGITPPDLTLSARVHSADWLYTYLMSFYSDPSRPLGTNNRLFPDVAMPNILEKLQGIQIPSYSDIIEQGKKVKYIAHLNLLKSGRMTAHQFQSSVNDLVSFLVYVSEPIQLRRIHIGYWVIGFLLILLVFAYLLKKEFWKDVK